MSPDLSYTLVRLTDQHLQTYSIFSSFFLASILYPKAHQLAREEIDRVVGRDRLPTFNDRDSLPYVEALVKEVMRWNPAAPLCKRFTYSTV